MTRPTAAVIGSGVAGLTAAYLLQSRYDVTLFEADDRLGGHAHTHELPTVDGRTVDVDTGFIVHNRRTYPNLLRLFGELGVATQESDMSMSVRCAGCGLEYAGARGIGGLFPQAANLARPAYLRMLAEVRRFVFGVTGVEPLDPKIANALAQPAPQGLSAQLREMESALSSPSTRRACRWKRRTSASMRR